MVPLFVVDVAMCMSRLFQEEIRHQTLPALMMLPCSVRYVTYSKVLGCSVGLIPGMIALLTAFLLLTESTRHFKENIENPTTFWIIANHPVRQLTNSETLWRLDVRPTEFEAEAAKAGGSTIVKSLGKKRGGLLTFASEG